MTTDVQEITNNVATAGNRKIVTHGSYLEHFENAGVGCLDGSDVEMLAVLFMQRVHELGI